jgi:hypothetical protein
MTTNKNEHQLVNPTTEAITTSFDGAPRLLTIAGAKLGIIDDSKQNADVLLEELAEVLKNKYEISGIQWHRKPSASRPADPEQLKLLTDACDAVVVAIGD